MKPNEKLLRLDIHNVLKDFRIDLNINPILQQFAQEEKEQNKALIDRIIAHPLLPRIFFQPAPPVHLAPPVAVEADESEDMEIDPPAEDIDEMDIDAPVAGPGR